MSRKCALTLPVPRRRLESDSGRPVREQLEHDRVIRLLQAKLKRKHEVAINVGDEQTAGIKVGAGQMFPDLVLTSHDKAHRLEGIIEVETGESVNHLEAMAQWAHFGRVRAPFHLYVPAAAVDIARRLCTENQVAVVRNLELSLARRPDPVHAGPPQRVEAGSSVRVAAPAPAAKPAAAKPVAAKPKVKPAPAKAAAKPAAKAKAPKPKAKARAAGNGKKKQEEDSLPHLRFIRDRRGYETTALVHTGGRRRGKGSASFIGSAPLPAFASDARRSTRTPSACWSSTIPTSSSTGRES